VGHIDDVTSNFCGTRHIAEQWRTRFQLIRRNKLGDRLAALGDHNRLAAASHPVHELEAFGFEFAGWYFHHFIHGHKTMVIIAQTGSNLH
jgi:hypothetical protein